MARRIEPAQSPVCSEELQICCRLILLDENFPDDQLPPLKEWRIRFRQIGRGVARWGINDPDIIPVLHDIGRVTFFTQDEDFFSRKLCHAAYCLVWLDVRTDDAALHMRRYLKHPRFRNQATRMGTVARTHYEAIHFWQRNRATLQRVEWVG